jgi:alkylated DNA repair dioxygenase AlkB
MAARVPVTRIEIPGRLPMAQAEVTWDPHWLPLADAEALFQRLRTETPWTQPVYRMRGQAIPMPREVAWYGEPGSVYSYSGVSHVPLPFTPALAALRQRLTDATGAQFNSVLLNRYRDGQDSVAWHADDEDELGPAPVIASVSLGACRQFEFKPRAGGARVVLALTSGSLVVMEGATQQHWLHQIPKTREPVGERINLTFRWFFSDDQP